MEVDIINMFGFHFMKHFRVGWKLHTRSF
jgi:hypothetical protein